MDFWEFAKALSRDEAKRLTGELQKELLEIDEEYRERLNFLKGNMCETCEIKGTEICITQCAEEMAKDD